MQDALIELFPHAASLPDFTPLLEARKRNVRELSLLRSPISQRTVAMLRKLGDWRLGLVTSAERADVEPVLIRAKIDDCFEACIFHGDVTRHKPAPDPYLAIAVRMGRRDRIRI